MRYIVSGEFTKIDETSGTIQNTSKINVVEVSDTNEKGSGIMLYPLEKFTFSKSIYARCVDGGGAEVRVVPFEVGTQGGGEQGTTPSGGGSGIAFTGMILGSASSTVDGGLWFEIVDGLPIVKMNCGGSTFALDAKPADGALIGDKLYLGGHIFKFTGFADGLTFSGNKFYVADTVVGTVSDYQFVFTDAAALSVAEGGTISITQLDTDVVDFSLDLSLLNSNPLPAPKLILGYFIQDQTMPNWIELPVKNYKASWSGTVRRGGLYLFAGTQGKINGISAPPSAMVGVGKILDNKKWLKEPTDMIADMSPINRYILRCISPSYTDPDCLGKFVFQVDATDSHSSVTIVIDATAQIST